MKKLLLLCSLAMTSRFVQTNENKQNKDLYFETQFRTLGTYCWVADEKVPNKLDFAQKNGVTEIYFMQNEANFPDTTYTEKTKNIVSSANERNLKIFRLIGKSFNSIKEFETFAPTLYSIIEQTIEYNRNVAPELKLAGINFDLEFPKILEFSKTEEDSMACYQAFTDCVVRICNKYKNQIQMDFYIGRYLRKVNYKGQQIELYKIVIDEADRTFIGSYSPADIQIKYWQEFIDYAKTKDKTIIYGASTCTYTSQEEMYEQFEELYKKTDYSNIGLQIHTLDNWFHNRFKLSANCKE